MHRISEELTRKQMIDPSTGSGRRPQLEKAGWYLRDHSKVGIEIPADVLSRGRVRRGGYNLVTDVTQFAMRVNLPRIKQRTFGE